MKKDETNDPSLSALLREWNVADPLPPRFEERVWQRIERNQKPAAVNPWAAFGAWFSSWFARPSLAASYLAVLLAVGLSAGYWRARTEAARMDVEMGTRYVQMMDPYQMPHH